MEETDADDLDLLQELLEVENELASLPSSDISRPSPDSQQQDEGPQSKCSFDSVLEGLDRIPVKSINKPTDCSDKTEKETHHRVKKITDSSVIHTGDTDSSDDEDNRKLEHRFNEYGASVKKMLDADAENEKISDGYRGASASSSWRSSVSSSSSSNSNLCLPSKKQKHSADVYTEPLIGIRIVNPLVSSAVIRDRLSGRKVVSFAEIKQFAGDGNQSNDWVVFGVIISKLPPKTSSKGSLYSIIRLSDLKGPGNLKTISVFLFSKAYKNHGKDPVGTVLGILNPGILDNSRNHNDEACLSVDNPDRIMVIGTSKDFGTCKSKKKNGENCTSIVNTAQCAFCVYHVKQEYAKCSRRSDIQSSFNGSGLMNLRNKVLGKNEVFYAGQSFTAVPAKKSKKLLEKDQKRLAALCGSKSLLLSPCSTQSAGKGIIATSSNLSNFQAQRDADRMQKLSCSEKAPNSSSATVCNPSLSSSDEIKVSEAKKAALTFVANKDSQTALPESSNEGAHGSSAETSSSAFAHSGAQATFVLQKNDIKSSIVKPSALGLGSNVSAKEGGHLKPSLEMKSEILRGKKVSGENVVMKKMLPDHKAKNFTPLSSKQLMKISSSGFNMQSRLLKQAALKTAEQEAASKLGPNCTPSMLGLGRLSVKSGDQNSPVLGRGQNRLSTIDLDAPISKSPSFAPFKRKSQQSAKLNAISLVRKSGGIHKEDPNFREFESRKKSVKQATNEKRGSKRPLCSIDISNSEGQNGTNIPENEEELKAKMARFKELMAASSKHTDLIEAAENEAQDEYFMKLEKKEQLEEKMLNTFRVACKAVRCLVCKYTAFSASDLCKSEQHALKVIDATKRFFKCGDCGNRTVSLELIPLKTCSNCNSSRWERAAMIRERKVGISPEILSVRGLEEKFVGSVATGGNINLLVPDES